MNNNLAILDLGTNTFHLLVVELAANNYKIIYKEKKFVKLGEFGLEQFNKEVIIRAVSTIEYYQKKIAEYNVVDAIIFGTAGLRMAANANVLINKIEALMNYKVKIISGIDEAKLIFYGVKQSLINFKNEYLIMDIGGGSVEFILVNNNVVLWTHSFNIGVSILKNKFHTSEPITQHHIEKLYNFLQQELEPLSEILKKYQTTTLIGASGSFDTIADMSNNVPLKDGFLQLPINDFKTIKQDLITKTYQERLTTKSLANQRADMIVVALILIDFVIESYKIKEMYKTDFALKEGIIWAYLNEPEYLNSL